MATSTQPRSKTHQYFRAVGRRKSATAIVRLTKAKGTLTVNGKTLIEYFAVPEYEQTALEPLRLAAMTGQVTIAATVKGGGKSAQSGALRLAIARALCEENPEQRRILKAAKLLVRDAREKERKKFGLKRARRAPQWTKR